MAQRSARHYTIAAADELFSTKRIPGKKAIISLSYSCRTRRVAQTVCMFWPTRRCEWCPAVFAHGDYEQVQKCQQLYSSALEDTNSFLWPVARQGIKCIFW